MGRYFLAAGTIVKHGTTLSRLESISKKGLLPRGTVDKRRQSDEWIPEHHNGVYVGGLAAYSAAYIAYSYEISDFLSSSFFAEASKCVNIPQLVDFITCSNLAELNTLLTLPVVINIRLGEDCELGADEDYIAMFSRGDLDAKAEEVWRDWRSGCILRQDGIPKEWIIGAEFPIVQSLNSCDMTRKSFLKDSLMFTMGLLQTSSTKMRPSEIQKIFRSDIGLSQGEQSIEQLLRRCNEIRGLSDEKNRVLNHFILCSAVTAQCYEAGIQLNH